MNNPSPESPIQTVTLIPGVNIVTIFCFCEAVKFPTEPALRPQPNLTKLSDMTYVSAQGAQDYGAYVFSSVEPLRGGLDGLLKLNFVPLLDATQVATPVLVNTGGTEPHDWPAVLYDLIFYRDDVFTVTVPTFNPATGTTGQVKRPRWNTQRIWLDPERLETPFTERTFVSTLPFKMRRTPHPQPMGREVSADFLPVLVVNIPPCLHDDIPIPEELRAYQTLEDGAETGSVQRATPMGTQTFTRTNFKRRAPYKVNGTPELMNGLWVMRQKEFFPPPGSVPSVIDDP